jgi:predicted lysophospholipase L1 biosynthesis ABC-type transport system permease subunit
MPLAGSMVGAMAGTALCVRPSAATHRQRSGPLLVMNEGMSRVGKVAIQVPDKVTVTVDGQTVKVKVSIR